MKRLVISCLVLILFSINNQLKSQEEPSGQLGDNFSLEGALDLLKNASSLEEFEKQLNSADSDVNNLNLNDDGEVDYIRVEEYTEKDVHVIVLQALISEEESQDVAVIELERTGEESATLQIVGDESLYGKDYFIEPFDEVATSNGNGGPSAEYIVSRVIVNVWMWPSVRNVYRPNYVVYRSPYRWRQYPRAWQLRRPLTWTVYNGRRLRYNHSYRAVKTHRVVRARRIYTPNRRTSAVVAKRSTNRSASKASRNKASNNKKSNKAKANRKNTKRKAKKKAKNNR